MPPICFIDGARFDDADGFLRALRLAMLGIPSINEACDVLGYLRRGAGAAGSRGRPRLHLVWLNSEVSRRRFRRAWAGPSGSEPWSRGEPPATMQGPGISFTAMTRWLGALRDIDLILL
jgi:hypothetical protein